jgi:hypothetical protein
MTNKDPPSRNRQNNGKPIGVEEKLDDGLGKWWFVTTDGCGLVCMAITQGLHIFSYWAQMKYIYIPWLGVFSWQCFLYTFVTLLAMYSHTVCQLTAPGCVPKHVVAPPDVTDLALRPEEDVKKYLYIRRKFVGRRLMVKPPSSHYCSEVGMTVLKMDHYCPWVNNVVGLFTQKYFLLFVFYTCLCTIWVAIILGYRLYKCTYGQFGPGKFRGWSRSQNDASQICETTPAEFIILIINSVEAIIFVIFTCAMGCDQYEAIGENTPYIDRLQKQKGKEQSMYATTCDVFGEEFCWRWFFPLKPTEQLRAQFQGTIKETMDILELAHAAILTTELSDTPVDEEKPPPPPSGLRPATTKLHPLPLK